jgi:hypothetical protein
VRRLIAATLVILAFRPPVQAQDRPVELTPAGKAILEAKLASDGGPLHDRPAPEKPLTFPLAMCTFPGGLCGAVRRDGSVAVPPRYDWVGTFSDGRAAVRSHGLYGFVDENGHETVPPRYRIVGDYKFGFTQVDIDGKSGLIDRDGKLTIEPRYGFIEATAPDRFRVSERRELRGTSGAEDFSDISVEFRHDDGRISGVPEETKYGIIDSTGQWIQLPGIRLFDPDDKTIRIVLWDNRWGLQRANRWLAKPQFNAVDVLIDGLARVRVAGRIGFIDRSGRFVIDPVFDEAWAFTSGFASTPVRQGRSAGAIDRTGAWMFRIEADELRRAISVSKDGEAQFGWHFRRYRVPAGEALLDSRWGLLDPDGHVLLEAEFDQPAQRCADGHLVVVKRGQWFHFRSDGTPLQPSKGGILDNGCGSIAPYIVEAHGKFGLIDGDGKEITPPAFETLIAVTKNVWNAKRDGKWGRIGPDGQWLFEPKFKYLSRTTPIIVAATTAKRGFLKMDGSWLIEPRYDAVRPRDSETAFVTMDGMAGVLRVQDQSWAVAPRPGVMCDIPYGILSQSDGRRAILSGNGEAWIDASVDRLGTDLETGLLPFLKDGKWGLMDTAGTVAIEPIYDEHIIFRPSLRGIAWAKRDGRSCPIDRHGQSVPGIACIERTRLSEGSSGYFRCALEP